MAYKIKLNMFEGPFDLLIYLIENAQMSIYDIKIAEITEQYLRYIDEIKKYDITAATEFMVLAATLIEIKSKLLLPRLSEDGKILETEDPRTELVARLLEYKKCKAAAKILENAWEEKQKIFEKPKEDVSDYINQPDEYLRMDIDQFVNAFKIFLRKKQKIAEVRRNYERNKTRKVTAEEKALYINEIFAVKGKNKVTFGELVEEEKSRYNIALTFSALLEMMKERVVIVRQRVKFGEMTIIKNDKEKEKKEA